MSKSHSHPNGNGHSPRRETASGRDAGRTASSEASDGVARIAKASGANREKLAHDLAALKASFVNLRDEVSSILSDAFQTEGKGPLPTRHEVSTELNRAREREALEQRTHTDALSRLTQKLRSNPIASAAVAFSVGFAISKLLTPRPKKRLGPRE